MQRILDLFFKWLEGLLDMPDALELEDDENAIID